MTIKYDNDAREKLINSLDVNDLKCDDIDLNKLEVRQMTTKDARGYIALFHYSNMMVDSTKFTFGGFVDDKLIGICCFGMGSSQSQYKAVIPDIQNGEHLELTRLWCLHEAPRNTESMLISRALKLLPPQYKLILSYADSSHGHGGTIYQATNWYYLGTTKGCNRIVDADGNEMHNRLISLYRQRHPHLKDKTAKEIRELYNWKVVKGGVKHRYVFLRGNKQEKKRMYNIIKDRIQPYPKMVKKDLKTDIEILLKRKAKQEVQAV